MTVRKLLREAMAEVPRSPAELAEVLEVPIHYVRDLISGQRRAPLPGRTDLYDRMTRFLRLARTDLADCAAQERAGAGADREAPSGEIRKEMLGLCEVETAAKLERRAHRGDGSEMLGILARVLDVVQGTVRRRLDDQIPLRLTAARTGEDYIDVRMRVLEFLDASPSTLTTADFDEFVRPQVNNWDVDLETGVLRVVLKSAVPTERHQRRPLIRTGRARLTG